MSDTMEEEEIVAPTRAWDPRDGKIQWPQTPVVGHRYQHPTIPAKTYVYTRIGDVPGAPGWGRYEWH